MDNYPIMRIIPPPAYRRVDLDLDPSSGIGAVRIEDDVHDKCVKLLVRTDSAAIKHALGQGREDRGQRRALRLGEAASGACEAEDHGLMTFRHEINSLGQIRHALAITPRPRQYLLDNSFRKA